MKILSSATVFSVSDIDASLHFYKEVIGGKDYFRFGDYAGILLGSVEIHLAGPSVPLKKTQGQGSIYVFCEGVDEAYHEIVSKGANVVVPIANQDYSMRDFVIQDPDGNLITLGQEIDQNGRLIIKQN